MVEVNSAYNQGRYEKIRMNSLHVMSNVKIIATQDSLPDRRTNATHYRDPYDTCMDENDKYEPLDFQMLTVTELPGFG